MGLSFLNYKKMVLDKMRSKVSSRWDVPSYCCVPIQKVWLCSGERGTTAKGVRCWAGVRGKQGTKRGRVGGSLSLRISPYPLLEGPWLQWKTESSVGFVWARGRPPALDKVS